MTQRFLYAALENMKFPEAVLEELFARFGASHASALACNPGVSPIAARLWAYKLPVEAATNIVSIGDEEALDAFLSSKERRDTVLDAVSWRWSMTAVDQIRFASRALSTKKAASILEDDFMCEEAKEKASFRAGVREHMTWLGRTDLDDEIIFSHLVKLSEKANLDMASVAGILISRPGLRGKAAMSGVGVLVLAAAWTSGLSVSQQREVLAMIKTAPPAYASPLCGLLLQPGTDLDVRAEAMAFARDNDKLDELARFGVRHERSMLHTGVHLADQENHEIVWATLDDLSLPRSDSWHRLAAASQLIDLAEKDNLDDDTARAVAASLSSYHSEAYASSVQTGMTRALIALADRLWPGESAVRELRKHYRISYSSEEAFELVRIRSRTREQLGAAEKSVCTNPGSSVYRYTGQWYSRNGGNAVPLDERVSEYCRTPRFTWHLSAPMTEAFGDGTTPESIQAWITCLTMADDHPGESLRQIIPTAKTLASIA